MQKINVPGVKVSELSNGGVRGIKKGVVAASGLKFSSTDFFNQQK